MTHDEFCADLSDFGTHLPVLWAALEWARNIGGEPCVVECGSGLYSTPKLKAYCEAHRLRFYSFDDHEGWCRKMLVECGMKVQHDSDYAIARGLIQSTAIGVLLIDGSVKSRAPCLEAAAESTNIGIVVCHDSNDATYGYEALAKRFKYRLDYRDLDPNTSAFSHYVDITGWEIQPPAKRDLYNLDPPNRPAFPGERVPTR